MQSANLSGAFMLRKAGTFYGARCLFINYLFVRYNLINAICSQPSPIRRIKLVRYCSPDG